MGGGKSRVKLIFDSLVAARGTAINAGDSTTVAYVETMAVARAIAAAWNTNQRLANQWDARRMSPAMLVRWERIFALTPDVADSLVIRRARVAQAQARVGTAALYTVILSELTEVLGSVLVAIEFISPTVAHVNAPAGAPFGAVNPHVPWSSTVAHILVRVQVPTGYADRDFYDAVSLIAGRLEPLLPAWATWNWYRAPETGAPIVVSGGPSAGGFYLDERNLDSSVFGS